MEQAPSRYFERPVMRYPSDQKARAKQAILQAGARALRTSGFKAIGVDGLAASAGVMSGAFYSNFSNKEALLEQVIETCLGEPFIDSESGSLAERHQRLKEVWRCTTAPTIVQTRHEPWLTARRQTRCSMRRCKPQPRLSPRSKFGEA